MKSVEIRSFFWSVFSCIRTEYEDLLRNTKIYYLDTFYAVLLYHNLQFRLPILPSLLLIQLQSEAVVRCCSAKKVFFQISQNSQENTKKEIPAQMFSCEFCEISHNIFFKERFGRLLQHKHSLCLLSHLAFLPIQ